MSEQGLHFNVKVMKHQFRPKIPIDFFFSDIAMVLRIVPTDQTKLRNAAAIKADNSLAKGAENVFRELAFATEYRIVRINPTNQIAVTSGTIL